MFCPVTVAAVSSQIAYVIDLLIVLATASVVALLLQRMRLAVIPAYLISGVIVGPGALGWIVSPANLEAIAQLAIVLLMFGIGLHMQLSVFGRNALRMIAAGVVSCVVSIVIGWPVATGFGVSAPAALALCMAMSLSSTAVVLRLITERGELRHAAGQLALSILVVQDLIVLAMLAALPAIARWSDAGGDTRSLPVPELEEWGFVLANSALRIGGIAAVIFFGRVFLPRLLTEAAREKSGEVMMIISIAVALGAAVLAHFLGFSMELGAFLAGFVLAGTPFRHQLTGQIAPLRDLFLAVFFTTLGMQLDPRDVAEHWWIVLVGGAAMSAIKAVAIGATCWALGASAAIAAAVGLALAQGGEFSLVLFSASQRLGIIDEQVASNAISIVVISLILTPALVEIGRRISRRMTDLPHAPWIREAFGAIDRAHVGPVGNRRHVILGGHGQVGSAIAHALDRAGVSYAVVDVDPDAVGGIRETGAAVILGDVANQSVLESAGLGHADALILTMPDAPAVLAASAIARRKRGKGLFIAARFEMASHARAARDLDVDHVTIEEVETARAMEAAVLRHLAR